MIVDPVTGEVRYGRPPKKPEERLEMRSLRLLPRQHRRLEEEARRRQVTVSDIVRELIDQHLPEKGRG